MRIAIIAAFALGALAWQRTEAQSSPALRHSALSRPTVPRLFPS